MLEQVQVAKDKVVTRVHPEAKVSKFTHHPTQVKPVIFLECSCGFSGFVAVDPDFGSEGGKPEVCPNCSSETVHPDNVTEFPTTHVLFANGEKHTMVGNKPEVVKPVEVEKPVSLNTVQTMIDDKFNQIISLLQQKQTGGTN